MREGISVLISMGCIEDSKFFLNIINHAAIVWSLERQLENVEPSFNCSGKHCLRASLALRNTILIF